MEAGGVVSLKENLIPAIAARQDVEDEFARRIFSKEAGAGAVAGVEHETDAHRKGGSFAEVGDGLAFAVLVDFKVALVKADHRQPALVDHRDRPFTA